MKNVHKVGISDQDVADFVGISGCDSYIGAWRAMSKSDALKVGDFVKVDTETKSMNPKIFVGKGPFGRVWKLDEESDPYVFFPDADYHCLGVITGSINAICSACETRLCDTLI